VKITSKGQVTIPKKIREEFGLLPGTEVEFLASGEELVVRKAASGRRRGEDVVEHLREAGKNFTMTTEEIMRLTRGENWGAPPLEDGGGDPS
jgi:AbrB family looped-hinge helix DNA binding protein